MRYHKRDSFFEENRSCAVIRELVKDDAILSQACEKATAQDAPIAEDLVETLIAHEDAACLAANQIGELKAIVA